MPNRIYINIVKVKGRNGFIRAQQEISKICPFTPSLHSTALQDIHTFLPCRVQPYGGCNAKYRARQHSRRVKTVEPCYRKISTLIPCVLQRKIQRRWHVVTEGLKNIRNRENVSRYQPSPTMCRKEIQEKSSQNKKAVQSDAFTLSLCSSQMRQGECPQGEGVKKQGRRVKSILMQKREIPPLTSPRRTPQHCRVSRSDTEVFR